MIDVPGDEIRETRLACLGRRFAEHHHLDRRVALQHGGSLLRPVCAAIVDEKSLEPVIVASRQLASADGLEIVQSPEDAAGSVVQARLELSRLMHALRVERM